MKLCGRRKTQSALREIFSEGKPKAPAPRPLLGSLEPSLRLHTDNVGREDLLTGIWWGEEGAPGPEQEYHPGVPLPSYLGPQQSMSGKPSSSPSPGARVPRHRETLIFSSRWCHQEEPGKGWAIQQSSGT